MMHGGRLAALFIAIFMMGAMPLMLLQGHGTAGAGLSSGLVSPLHDVKHVMLFLLVGVLSAQLGARSYFMLPLAFLMMMTVGTVIDLESMDSFVAKGLILGAIIIFGLIASNMHATVFVVSSIFTSFIAFILGADYGAQLPHIASPVHYLMGVLIGTSFLLVGGVCLGLTLSGMASMIGREMESVPALSRTMRIAAVQMRRMKRRAHS